MCCEQGEGGLTKSAEDAFRYFQLAANEGLARAQDKLGVCYEEGNGVSRDSVAAYTITTNLLQRRMVIAVAVAHSVWKHLVQLLVWRSST